ncbi:MAG: hypothetical protein F6K47_22815 [Symploca sp. SIO2E6]|nr:hypothetical protein [Symploca sp. SIO2E6]
MGRWRDREIGRWGDGEDKEDKGDGDKNLYLLITHYSLLLLKIEIAKGWPNPLI